jgi:hypothetical protein
MTAPRDVSRGSKASSWRSGGLFRSAPINGHSQRPPACLKGANFGIGSVVTARNEVVRGPPPRGQPRLTAPGGTNCPEGRYYQALYPRPEPNLDCAVPQ